uniref:Spindle assembly abnormal protein 6 N-terminal domain-containing protein n=1 Tax=Mantoniella antarctica TaxID=81844 RepID=A0A7S0XE79_9CHLO
MVSDKALVATLQSGMDFSQLEELDPSLSEGHRLFYEREVPFELRSADGVEEAQEVGALEAIRVKILTIGEEDAYTAMRVEISSESNLFFYYTHDLDDSSFRTLQEGQKLMVDFAEYPSVIVRNLNHCIKEPHSHLAVFVMMRDGSARLDFIQNMEYKFVELLSLNFLSSPEDMVRQQIAYRYNSLKSRLALMQARLADVNALVKIKNPNLLLQLQKEPAGKKGTFW